MCAGDTALHDLDTVDITLTRAQAIELREMLVFSALAYDQFRDKMTNAEQMKKTAFHILQQLPKESA